LQTQKNLSPGGVTSCISIFGSAHLSERLSFLLRLIVDRNVQLNTKQSNALMTAFNRCKLYDRTIQLFVKMGTDICCGSNELAILHSLLVYPNSNTTASNSSSLLELEDLINRSAVVPQRDEYSIGALFTALEKRSLYNVTNIIFDKIPSRKLASAEGIFRNTVIYNSAIAVASRVGNWRSALKM